MGWKFDAEQILPADSSKIDAIFSSAIYYGFQNTGVVVFVLF